MANKTFTFPASQKYIDKDLLEHTITTSETFQLEIIDDGTTARYKGVTTGSSIACADGFQLYLEGDQNLTFMNVTADATAVTDAGDLWFVEDGNNRAEWHIRSVELDDADATSSCTMTMERADNPTISITWTSLTVA